MGGYCCATPCITAGPCGSAQCTAGSGLCEYIPSLCNTPGCSGGVEISPAMCQDGVCPAASKVACAPYGCNQFECLTSCSTDSDCTSGYFCNGSACDQLQSAGSRCFEDGGCISGSCLSKNCCTSPCITNGPCAATGCDSSGACTYPSGACDAGGNCSNGVCLPP